MGEKEFRNRVDNRHVHVARIRREAIERVVELNRCAGSKQHSEIAVAHGIGNYACRIQPALVPARAQVIAKEEKLVVQNGAADVAAELGEREWIDCSS